MTRNGMKILGAVAGAAALATATPSAAQQAYVTRPGFSVGVGSPYFHGYYGYPHFGPYARVRPLHRDYRWRR